VDPVYDRGRELFPGSILTAIGRKHTTEGNMEEVNFSDKDGNEVQSPTRGVFLRVYFDTGC
jgi:hypothetical protein